MMRTDTTSPPSSCREGPSHVPSSPDLGVTDQARGVRHLERTGHRDLRRCDRRLRAPRHQVRNRAGGGFIGWFHQVAVAIHLAGIDLNFRPPTVLATSAPTVVSASWCASTTLRRWRTSRPPSGSASACHLRRYRGSDGIHDRGSLYILTSYPPYACVRLLTVPHTGAELRGRHQPLHHLPGRRPRWAGEKAVTARSDDTSGIRLV